MKLTDTGLLNEDQIRDLREYNITTVEMLYGILVENSRALADVFDVNISTSDALALRDSLRSLIDPAVLAEMERQQNVDYPLDCGRAADMAVLREVSEILSDSLSAEGISQWLFATNRLLNAKPFDAIVAGRHNEVRAAAQAFIDESHV